MGFKADDIDSLPAYDDLTFTPERVARYPNGEQPDDPSLDTSMDEIETFECYIRTDFDKEFIAKDCGINLASLETRLRRANERERRNGNQRTESGTMRISLAAVCWTKARASTSMTKAPHQG